LRPQVAQDDTKQKHGTKNKEGRQWEKTSVAFHIDLLWSPFPPSIAPSPLVRPLVAQVAKNRPKRHKKEREKRFATRALFYIG
jgi:hypothetical protein